ncbi:unnamed protein product [Periconia digitata]|uniref:Uncharacterized protein n=1 Tax=Periconia digitata TaxID=1303443 RepID=A0A9W4UAM4_9PLEO|nr:unnamed protein product [Periconia digitata]
MRFSLVLVAALAGLNTALPQRGNGNGKSRIGRPAGQNNQNNQDNIVPVAQQGNGAAAGAQTQAQAQAPAATAAPNGKGNGKGNGAQAGAATSAANNQAPQNTAAAAAGNANNGNANGNGAQAGANNGNGNGNANNGNGAQAGANNGNANGNANNGNGQAGQNGAFDASLVPEFGIEAGQQPDGAGNCIGNNNVKIPCSCPPDRQEFIQKVQAAAAAGNSEGVPVEFPTDNSSASEKARIGTSIIVLQNLNGLGQGCPAAATNFLAQQAAA